MLFVTMSQTSRSFNCFNTDLKKSDLKEKGKKIYLVTPLFQPVLVTPLWGFTNNQSDSKTVLDYLTLGGEKLFWTIIRFWETYIPPTSPLS